MSYAKVYMLQFVFATRKFLTQHSEALVFFKFNDQVHPPIMNTRWQCAHVCVCILCDLHCITPCPVSSVLLIF